MKEEIVTGLILKKIASVLAKGDLSYEKDLVQEMALAILESPDGMTRSWYISRARYRARDYLKKYRKKCQREICSGLVI